MSLTAALALLFVSTFIIAKSADLVVVTAVKLARQFNVSEFSLGFFILGLATTTPEIFVGIHSAFAGKPELSLGNLIGASILLLTFIIGINAVVSGEVHFIKTFTYRDMWSTSFVILAPAFLLLDGDLTRIDGFLLLTLYILFYLAMNKEQSFSEHIKHELVGGQHHLGKSVAFLLAGVIGLFASAKVIIVSATAIASILSLPLVLIGLLLLSIGTNLPEITVLATTIRRRHKQVGIGDFLGSAVANTPVLGLVAIIHPINLSSPLTVYVSLGMLLLALLTFNAYFTSHKTITRLEGLSLIALYAFFIFAELVFKNRF